MFDGRNFDEAKLHLFVCLTENITLKGPDVVRCVRINEEVCRDLYSPTCSSASNVTPSNYSNLRTPLPYFY